MLQSIATDSVQLTWWSSLGSSFYVFHALLRPALGGLVFERRRLDTVATAGPVDACWCILCLAAIGGSGPCIPKSHFVGSLAQNTLLFRLFPTTSMKQNSTWFCIGNCLGSLELISVFPSCHSWMFMFLCDPGWANYCILRMRPFQGNQVSFSLFSCFILLPKDIVELPCHFWYSTSDLWNIETSLWNRVDNMLRLDDIGRISFYFFNVIY